MSDDRKRPPASRPDPRRETPSPMPAVRPPFPSRSTETGDAEMVGAALASGSRAERIAERLRDDWGAPPSELHPEGSGYLGVIFSRFRVFESKVDAIEEKVDSTGETTAAAIQVLRDELAHDRKQREEARAPWSRAAWIVAGALLAAAALAAWQWVATLHH